VYMIASDSVFGGRFAPGSAGLSLCCNSRSKSDSNLVRRLVALNTSGDSWFFESALVAVASKCLNPL
jgi:hypothetical protein